MDSIDVKGQQSNKKGKGFLFLSIIILIGAALRLYALARYSMWYDEGAVLFHIDNLEKSFVLFDAKKSFDMPVFSVLVFAWKVLIDFIPGLSSESIAYEYLLRLLPCIFGILTIPAVFVVTRKLTGDLWTALIASFVFSISPFQVYYAQELRAYTLHILAITVTLYFFLKALETNSTKNWICVTIFMVLCVNNHSSSVWVLAIMNMFFVLTITIHKRQLLKWFISQCAVFVLCIPALMLASAAGKIMNNATAAFYPSLPLKTMAITYKAFFAGYSANVLAYKILCIIVVLMSILGLLHLLKRPKSLGMILLLAILPVLIEFCMWRYRSNNLLYFHRHLIFSAIPCYILVAHGIRVLPGRITSVVVVVLIMILTLPCLADHYAQRLHPIELHYRGARYKNDNRNSSKLIKENFKSNDTIVHASSFSILSYTGYYLKKDQSIICFTEQDRRDALLTIPNRKALEDAGLFPMRVDPLLENADRVWFVQSSWLPAWYTTLPYEPRAYELMGWLDGQNLRLQRAGFDGANVFLYKHDSELRARTETYQIADYGELTLMYNRWLEEDKNSESAKTWNEAFVKEVLTLAESEPELYGVHLGPGIVSPDDEDVAYSFPLTATGKFNYTFVIKNNSSDSREVKCSILESALSIDAMSLRPEAPEADVWCPRHVYSSKPFGHVSERLSLEAHLTDEETKYRSLYFDSNIEPGDYEVYALYYEVHSREANQPQLELRVDSVSPNDNSHEFIKNIGKLDGYSSEGKSGWVWRYIGEHKFDGKNSRILISALNPENHKNAYARLQDLALVHKDETNIKRYVPNKETQISLAPFEEKSLTFDSDMMGKKFRQINIEFSDQATGTYRELNFRVHNANE